MLGPLAMFDVGSATATEALPLSEPAAIAALPDADKLMMRARLQVGHNPLLLGAAAPEVQHGYGDGLDPAQLCRGDLVQPVHLGRWTIRWPNLAQVEVVDWLEPRHHRHQRAGSAADGPSDSGSLFKFRVIPAKLRARMHYFLVSARGSPIQAMCEPTGSPMANHLPS